jgi:hypothetical protein
MLRQSSKQGTLLGVNLQEPDLKEVPIMAHCVHTFPSEYGRSCFGETGRPLAVRLCEHKRDLREGLLEIPKLAPRAYEQGHRVSWDEAKIFEVDDNNRYRKYKRPMWHITNPISQSSLEISLIWLHLIRQEVINS